ncbi:MAG: hypothetical protein P8L85_02305 [Rubripirellula sp.]|nr:hypothetical protein [Rubripirellula sp.]
MICRRRLVRNYTPLACISLLVTAIWMVVLPWLASQPTIQARLDFLEHHRIDPSAMFYTELDAMEPILDRLEDRGANNCIRIQNDMRPDQAFESLITVTADLVWLPERPPIWINLAKPLGVNRVTMLAEPTQEPNIECRPTYYENSLADDRSDDRNRSDQRPLHLCNGSFHWASGAGLFGVVKMRPA